MSNSNEEQAPAISGRSNLTDEKDVRGSKYHYDSDGDESYEDVGCDDRLHLFRNDGDDCASLHDYLGENNYDLDESDEEYLDQIEERQSVKESHVKTQANNEECHKPPAPVAKPTAMKTKSKFYAVAKGKNPGVYENWGICKDQVHRYSGAVYKSFNTRLEAETFISEYAEYKADNQSINKCKDEDNTTHIRTKIPSPVPKNKHSNMNHKNTLNNKKKKNIPNEGPFDHQYHLLQKGDIVQIKNEGRWTGSCGMIGKITDFTSGSGQNTYVTIETKQHGPLSRKAKNLAYVGGKNTMTVSDFNDLNKALSDFQIGKH